MDGYNTSLIGSTAWIWRGKKMRTKVPYLNGSVLHLSEQWQKSWHGCVRSPLLKTVLIMPGKEFLALGWEEFSFTIIFQTSSIKFRKFPSLPSLLRGFILNKYCILLNVFFSIYWDNHISLMHHRLNGHGFGWTPGVGDGQRGLVCCGSWGSQSQTWGSNWTELKFTLRFL